MFFGCFYSWWRSIVIARSEATKQSMLPSFDGLLRFARNDEKTLNPLFFGAISADSVSQCDVSGSRLKLWNESGTNRARIGDSHALRLRSPQHLAWSAHERH
jgi:hypothetical protein